MTSTSDRTGSRADDTGTGTGAAARGTRWRPVDIVVASVLGVVGGLVFLLWNVTGQPALSALSLYPPIGALLAGIYVLPGVLVALVVRKPGAAVYGELLAATVEALLGSHWGLSVLYYGLIQGLGAEVVFLLGRYRRWILPVALLAGAGAGLAQGLLDLLTYVTGLTPFSQVLYVGATTLSGLVVAGVLSWLVLGGLQRSGALSGLASGRGARRV